MNILTDTHIFIWIMQNNSKLSPQRKSLILDPLNNVWVCQFSLMEIAIKLKIGKLPDITYGLEFLVNQWQNDGYKLLPISDVLYL